MSRDPAWLKPRLETHPVSFANRPVVGEILPVDICTFFHLFSFVENEMSV